MSDQQAPREPVQFLMLLKFTDAGRKDAEKARRCLEAAPGVLHELQGTSVAMFMTFGPYDAAIAGVCPSLVALASFAGWVNEREAFSSITLPGVDPDKYEPFKHR